MTTPSKLKSYVERIETIESEAKEVGSSKRDVFDEAEEAGFSKKALRRAIRDRKEAAKDKETAELAEQYRALLESPGATYRSVAEQTGASKSKLQRLVPRKENGTAPHDPTTGEVKEESCGGEVKALATSPAQGPVVSSVPLNGAVAGRSTGTSQSLDNRPAGVAPGPQDSIEQDDLALPPFLERKVAA